MNRNILKSGASLATVALALTVSGCSTGGGTVAVDSILSLYAEDAGSPAAALNAGTTLAAKAGNATNAGIHNNWGKSTSEVDDSAAFSIAKNDSGGVDVEVNGETTSFASADATSGGDGWKKTDSDGVVTELYSWNGTTDEVLSADNTDASQLWNYYMYGGSANEEHLGYAVTGTLTNPDALEGMAEATYYGYGAVRTYGKDDPDTQTQVQSGTGNASKLYGVGNTGIKLTADFDAATIGGEAVGLVAKTRSGGVSSDYAKIDGRVVFGEASIEGNGYSGKVTGADGLPVEISDGATYAGHFYGETAQETAGTISIDGDDTASAGFFRAFKSD